MEYPFITITPRLTLTTSGNTWVLSISKIKPFDLLTVNKQSHFGRRETSIQKIRKETSHYIPITLVKQDLHTPLYSNKNSNLNVCQTSCTVKHFLIECKVFTHIRKSLYNVNHMKDHFENINIDEFLSYQKYKRKPD